MATSEQEIRGPSLEERGEEIPPIGRSGRRRRPGIGGILFGGTALAVASVAGYAFASSGSEDTAPEVPAAPADDGPEIPPSSTGTTELPSTTLRTTTTTEAPAVALPADWQVFDEEAGIYRAPTPEEAAFAQTPCESLYADGAGIALLRGKYCLDSEGILEPITTDVWHCTREQETALWQDEYGWGFYDIESHQWQQGEHLTAEDVSACVGSTVPADPPMRNPNA